jgi:hypothetical protein
MKEDPFASIIGEKLSAVVFILDYVQLQFDGPTLTCLRFPFLLVEGKQISVDQQGYRDRLCEQIGKTVAAVSTKEDVEILITFSDNSAISISLKPEDYCGPEIVTFDDGTGQMRVW